MRRCRGNVVLAPLISVCKGQKISKLTRFWGKLYEIVMSEGSL